MEGFRRGCVGGWVRGSDYSRMPACRHAYIASYSLNALTIVQQRSSFLFVRLLYTMLIELHHHRRPRPRPRPRAGRCGWPSAPGVSSSTLLCSRWDVARRMAASRQPFSFSSACKYAMPAPSLILHGTNATRAKGLLCLWDPLWTLQRRSKGNPTTAHGPRRA